MTGMTGEVVLCRLVDDYNSKLGHMTLGYRSGGDVKTELRKMTTAILHAVRCWD